MNSASNIQETEIEGRFCGVLCAQYHTKKSPYNIEFNLNNVGYPLSSFYKKDRSLGRKT